ncbi:hypothetical protein SDC9_92722 [bioreactor metagenome]|uniref:Uncharacterized protein n=1 Tax=bioreactor metagenome TaxID=1076179 RepID=A0A644ZZZ4_9ZZZZ
MDQQLPRLFAVHPDQSRDRIDGIEKEMWIHLRLQGLDFGILQQFALEFDFSQFDLAGEDVAESFRQLPFDKSQFGRIREIQLQSADRFPLRFQRDDERRLQGTARMVAADFVVGMDFPDFTSPQHFF